MSVLSAAAQQEISALNIEANALSTSSEKITQQQRTRFNWIMSRVSQLKSGALLETRTREDLQREAARVVEEITGTIVAPIRTVADETRHAQREQAALREYLTSGKETRTYSGMSIATGSAGAYLVPQSMSDKVWTALKQADRLFDPDVVTFYESQHGNS